MSWGAVCECLLPSSLSPAPVHWPQRHTRANCSCLGLWWIGSPFGCPESLLPCWFEDKGYKLQTLLIDFTSFPLKLWQSTQRRLGQLIFRSVLMIHRSKTRKESAGSSYFLEQLYQWCQRSDSEVGGQDRGSTAQWCHKDILNRLIQYCNFICGSRHMDQDKLDSLISQQFGNYPVSSLYSFLA